MAVTAPKGLEDRVSKAVRHFWKTRTTQAKKQLSNVRSTDRGARSAVTGGAQMDGFAQLIADLLAEAGIERPSIRLKGAVELPGYYRPTKKWDLLVVDGGRLVAALEFKSQVGPSFGNNFNNRSEEAIGSATDINAAYREGAFKPSLKPWMGYLMLLEDCPGSTTPVTVAEPYFKVFPEFKDSSYEKRYQILCKRLVREQLYNASSFILSDAKKGLRGTYREPDPELEFRRFVTSLLGHAQAHLQSRKP